MTHTIAPVNSYGSPATAARTGTAPTPMNWTCYLTYTALGLSPDDTGALRDTLGATGLVYDPNTGWLQVTLEVAADTLDQAVTAALHNNAATATGLLKPTRMYMLSSADAAADAAHPAPIDLDLISLTEIADELEVGSRQRAGKLAEDPDFPQPVLHTQHGRLWTRVSVRAFKDRWEETKNPRGGRRRRTPNPIEKH